MSEKFNEIAKGSFLRVNEEGKAYWGQSEGGSGGGGGGVQAVEITTTDGSTYTSSHTGAEINAMAMKGAVVANMKVPESGEIPLAYFGASRIIGEGFSLSFGASFAGGCVDKSMGTTRYGVMYFYVDPETKEVSFKEILF